MNLPTYCVRGERVSEWVYKQHGNAQTCNRSSHQNIAKYVRETVYGMVRGSAPEISFNKIIFFVVVAAADALNEY